MTTSSVTPMMSQFLKIKERYKNALLFYRMGDFYELFFEDAEIASAALNITLTKRGKYNGKDIPMCGVPYHSSENYLLNLIRKGYKVAVCEQLEKPEEAKKRGHKAVVKRDVVRLITPGTLTEERLLNDNENNFLLSYSKHKNNCSVAWTDISTGEFYCSSVNDDNIISLINRISPTEILIAENFQEDVSLIYLDKNIVISPLAPQNFDSKIGKIRLQNFFNVISIDTFGNFTRSEIGAMAALLSYLEITQCTKSIPLLPPIKEINNSYLKIDSTSRQSLEIIKTLSGQTVGSLFGSINRTLTSGGSRLLQDRLKRPLTDVNEITGRQDIVTFFLENQSIMITCRDILKQTPDMQRSLSRIGLKRGNPKDLCIIRNCLRSIADIKKPFLTKTLPPLLLKLIQNFNGFDTLLNTLNSTLIENPSVARGEEIIRSSYNERLKKFRNLKNESQKLLIDLQLTYIKITSINSLKIKYNNVLGYFIETPISYSKKMTSYPISETFVHRQTTTNCVRFSTLELSDLASNILNAQENAEELQRQIITQLTTTITQNSLRLNSAATALSECDFYSSLSFQSVANKWIKPTLDESKTFKITSGRHPVVELALKDSGADNFISNNCDLNPNGNLILLLTGPNMAGKSTYLRQNALIVVLAQIGSYVPAEKAHIGVIDQIFSRVGASDDISKGNSTFMVEMIETASILKNATNSSLIIMDEIGRGTSTYDGLSIAWATVEYIHDFLDCRTLFATHYHELTALQTNYKNIKNATITIREWKDEVIFLHQVISGTANKSYGIQVAKLAGLPNAVTDRAKSILKKLEKSSRQPNLALNSNQPANIPQEKVNENWLEIIEMLLSLNTDEMTPKQALTILDETIVRLKQLDD